MTKNQIAIKNIARGSVRAQVGRQQLKPACRRRLDEGAIKKWQELDAARTARYKKNRLDRERKAKEAEGRKSAEPA
jgi:hypothetical protein